MIRYLAANFPKVLDLPDNAGRTALHYAAATPKDAHNFYRILTNCGANAAVKDKSGCTAETYLKTKGKLPFKDLQELVRVSTFGGKGLALGEGFVGLTAADTSKPQSKTRDLKSSGEFNIVRLCTELLKRGPKEANFHYCILYKCIVISHFSPTTPRYLKNISTHCLKGTLFDVCTYFALWCLYPIAVQKLRLLTALTR